MDTLEDRLNHIRERIATAATQAGRSPEDVTLIAVSKTYPPEAVREAEAAGQLVFGENRVQEALSKIPELSSRLSWHLIGHLQSNKIRKALPHFALFHGVDSLDLATAINRIAAEDGHRPGILLEVNIAGEASKFGFKPEALDAEIERLLELPRLEIRGLMGMAPIVEKPEDARPYFARLREIRDRLNETHRLSLTELSMGMSGDFEAAILEGATFVRVGTAIFGNRPRAQSPQ